MRDCRQQKLCPVHLPLPQSQHKNAACLTVTHSICVRGEKAKLPASSLEVRTNTCLHLFTFNSNREIWSLKLFQLQKWSPAVTAPGAHCGNPHTFQPALHVSAQRWKKPPQLSWSIISSLGSWQPGHEKKSSSKLKARARHIRMEHSMDLVHLPSTAKQKVLAQPSPAQPTHLWLSHSQSCSPTHSTNLLTFTSFSWLYITVLLSEGGRWKDARRRKRMWNAVSEQTSRSRRLHCLENPFFLFNSHQLV